VFRKETGGDSLPGRPSITQCLNVPSGRAALPLNGLATAFTERKAWQYNSMLTRPVMEFLEDTGKHGLSVNREVIVRAAQYYYASGPGEKPPLADEALHRVR
jgi:hypothetical protein